MRNSIASHASSVSNPYKLEIHHVSEQESFENNQLYEEDSPAMSPVKISIGENSDDQATRIAWKLVNDSEGNQYDFSSV